MPIQRVLRAIDEIKKGNMVIMMDDEDRENEGDLVYAATFSTPEKVNFMASYAKGLICTTITTDTAQRLDLTPMVRRNNSQHETAFTISIDSVNATTGISAFERDETIRLLADELSTAEHFVRPGHIFPLIAKDGGVLERVGHTEGATDLCKMAGVYPCGVICEIMKDDGTMARKDDLELFAIQHNLCIVYISDLVQYRLERETLIHHHSKGERTFLGVKAHYKVFQDHLQRLHTVYTFGEHGSVANVKFHTLGSEWELLHDNERLENLQQSLTYLQINGGIFVLFDTKMKEEDSHKDYGIGAQILREMGISEICLISRHHQKELPALHGFGLEILDVIAP